MDYNKEGYETTWADPLWSCRECSCCRPMNVCCMAYFLPCVLYANNAKMLETGQHLDACDCGTTCSHNSAMFMGMYLIGEGLATLTNVLTGIPGLGCWFNLCVGPAWASKHRIDMQKRMGIDDTKEQERCTSCSSKWFCASDESFGAKDAMSRRAFLTYVFCMCPALVQEYKHLSKAAREQTMPANGAYVNVPTWEKMDV